MWVGFLTSCLPAGYPIVVWLERGENTINPNQECPPRSTVYEEGIVMTMIGIDPHKATHTAVAVDDNEVVLDEFRARASTVQAQRLREWAGGFGKREWAVESANGLGYMVAQQLVAAGETVFDVPPVLASRVRVLGSGRSQKNDPNDARSVAIAALRSDRRTSTLLRYRFTQPRPANLPRRANRTLNRSRPSSNTVAHRHDPTRPYRQLRMPQSAVQCCRLLNSML